MAAFSGIWHLLEHWLSKLILRNGKKLLYVGKIFAVTDGVITGCFDKNANLDKA